MQKDLLVFMFAGFIIGSVVGFVFGARLEYSVMKDSAIEHGAAHYDKVTGNWEWNK